MKKLKLFLFIIAIIATACFAPIAAVGVAILPFMAGQTSVSDLVNMSRNFSSFPGFEGEDYSNYTGENDEFVDFGSPERNFGTSEERIFTMTITNGNGSTRYAYILPGINWAPGIIGSIAQDEGTKAITVNYPNGYVRTGTFNDKNGDAGLSASGSPKTIETFLSFISIAPTHCHKIKIQANTNASQMSQQLTIQPMSPFKTLESTTINPDSILDQYVYQSKVVMFNVDLVLAKDLQIEYPITGSDVVTISFFCDGIMNPSVAMNRKVQKAKVTASKLGVEYFRNRSIAKDQVQQERKGLK